MSPLWGWSLAERNGKIWRDLTKKILGMLEGGVREKKVLDRAKAVSAMQACALHLCHRSPRHWRACFGRV
jgi:hypothetical protein